MYFINSSVTSKNSFKILLLKIQYSTSKRGILFLWCECIQSFLKLSFSNSKNEKIKNILLKEFVPKLKLKGN